MKNYFDPFDFGAIGTGIVDDTAALQHTIDTAAAIGGVVAINGVFRTSAPLTIHDSVSLLGIGYAGDGNGGYRGTSFYPIPVPMRGGAILPGAHNAIDIKSNRAVRLENFQISYSQGAQSGLGLTAIKLAGDVGPQGLNTGSRLRNVCVTNADYALRLTNAADFVVDDCPLLYSWMGGIIIENPNYPSVGNGLIRGCKLWGGAISQTFHVLLLSHGGLRISENSFYAGGAASNGIQISPITQGEQIEPLQISDNTIEGCTNGIAFSQFAGDGQCSQVTIVGNQIWAGGRAIFAGAFQNQIWIRGMTVTGNVLTSNGGPPIVDIDGVEAALFNSNSFNVVSPPSNAIVLGAHTANISASGNVYGAGVIP